MLDSIHDGPEAIDPAEALLHEVGAHLRDARQQHGKEIEDVAEILRIQPGYVAALERGDLSVMPGRTYALGFLRSYANYLGFDGDDLLSQIKSSVSGAGGKAALQSRTPLSESRLPKVPILVVSLAVLAGAYAGWAYVQHGQAVPDLVDEVPPELRGKIPFDAGRVPLESGSNQSTASPTGHLLAAARSAPEPRGALPAGLRADRAQPAPDGKAAGKTVPTTVAMTRTGAGTPVPMPAPRAEATPAYGLSGVRERTSPVRVIPAIAPAPATIEAKADKRPAARPAMTAPEAEPARAADGGAASAGAHRERWTPPSTMAAVASTPDSHGETRDDRDIALGNDSDTPAAAVTTETPRPPRTYGTRTSGTRVVLRARSKTWVHVSSTHNDFLWVQTLRPGDSFVVPDRPDLVLWTGNAGGVEMLVDGALLPPLGPEKRVMRDVSLRPRDLMRRLLPLPPVDDAVDEALVEPATEEDTYADGAEVSDLASTVKPPMIWRSSRSTGNHRTGEISEHGRSE